LSKHSTAMIKRLLLVTIILTKVIWSVKSQNAPASLQQITPKSPNAAAIQKFGDWPVGHSTGLPAINIPLFNLQSGKLNLPVSISYHSGGMRMNDIGSNVGMGWAVMAGGVINRTMMGGQPDDRTAYGYWQTYPIDTSAEPAVEYGLMKAYAAGLYDAQPDIFSYNFGNYSGKFLFDKNKNISLLPYNNLKIKDSIPSQTPWYNLYTGKNIGAPIVGFTVTVPDGSRYFFSEPNSSTSQTKTYDKFAGECCGPTVEQFQNQEFIESYYRTWNLSLIVSADKRDSIKFEYDSSEIVFTTPGVSSHMKAAQFEGNIPLQLNSSYSHQSIVKNHMLEKWLKKIVFKNGYLRFYQNSSRRDLNGGKKLDSIILFNSSDQRIKAYVFNYKYLKGTDLRLENELASGDSSYSLRMFLTSCQESDKNSQLQLPYVFDYEHSLALPNKDKAGGDYWGIVNGKSWDFLADSLVLTTSGTELDKYISFSDGLMGALKAPYANYAKQGVLTKITYPTGGYSQFEYEANTGPIGTIHIPVEVCDGGGSPFITNENFINNEIVGKIRVADHNEVIPVSQVSFLLAANYDSFPPQYVVEIRDSATNFLVHTFTHDPTNFGASCDTYIPSPIPICRKTLTFSPGHTYYIKARNNGAAYQSIFPPDELGFCYVSFSPFNCRIEYQSTGDSVVAGGIRIKQISDFDWYSGKKVVKKYEYANPFRPDPLGSFMTETLHSFCGSRTVGGVTTPLYSEEGQKILSSASSYSLVDLNGSHIRYGIVKETTWDSASQKGNGFTVYKFNVDFADQPDFTNFKFLPYPPFVGDSWMVGQPEGKFIWKSVNDTNILLQSEEYRYSPVKLKNRTPGEALFHQNIEHFGESVYDGFSNAQPCAPLNFIYTYSEFVSQSYVKHQKFNYSSNYNTLDSVIVKTYDDFGTVSTTVQAYDYDTTYLLPFKIVTTNSKNEKITQRIKYPFDFPGLSTTDAITSGIKYLQTNRILTAEVEKSAYKSNYDGTSNRLVSSVFNSFKTDAPYESDIKVAQFITPLTDFAAASVASGAITLDSRYRNRVSFNLYDNDGHLLEQQKEKDVKNAYIWDYNNDLVIAEVINSPASRAAFTSFEANGKGGWAFSGTIVDTVSIAGIKSYNLSTGNVTKSGLTNGTYIVSYWGRNGSNSVNSASPTIIGKTIGNWTYYEHEVTGTAITISGSNFIDELRLYPKGAQMMTYTHVPLLGMASKTDANNHFTYYEYDSFGRLFLVRDEDKNILNRYDYKYQHTYFVD
jgi:hypothetical protein